MGDKTASENNNTKRHPMTHTPEFRAAVDRHHAMRATLGPDHPLTMRAFTLVVELAPKELQTIMADKARELGLIPEADGYQVLSGQIRPLLTCLNHDGERLKA